MRRFSAVTQGVGWCLARFVRWATNDPTREVPWDRPRALLRQRWLAEQVADRAEIELRLDAFLLGEGRTQTPRPISDLRLRRAGSGREFSMSARYATAPGDLTVAQTAEAFEMGYSSVRLVFRYVSGYTRTAYLHERPWSWREPARQRRWFGQSIDGFFADVVVLNP